VNGYASTPYDTAVGGTDFYYGIAGAGTYWSTTNNADYGSAKSYIPEQPWDDSYQATDSNSGTSTVYGGGGGFSTVGNVAANGTTVSPYPVPSWQSTFVPGSTARAIPDVSFFAGNDYNSAEYAICAQPTDCITEGTSLTNVTLTGGTAGAAGVFAGIMAEVVEKHGAQGNANPALYGLHSTAGIFHATTTGTNSMACSGGTGCSGGYLKVTGLYAYEASAAYNEATGLGSINATNLINDWAIPATKASTTALAINNNTTGTSVINGSVVHGTYLNFVATVTGSGGTPTGDVAFTTGSILPSENGMIAEPLSGGVASSIYNDFLPGGTYDVTARYGGDSTFEPSVTSEPITITPEPSRILTYSTSPASGSSVVFGTLVKVTAEPFSMNNNDVSTPTGSLSVFDGGSYPFLILPLTSEGTATFSSTLLPGNASYSIYFTYSGDPSFQTSSSSASPYKITVTTATSTTAVAATSASASTSVPVTLTATVEATTGSLAASTGVPPTGNVTFNLATATTVNLVSGFNASGQAIGVATVQVPTTQVPGGAFTVTYNGDNNYATSNTSTTLTTTTPAGTATTLTLAASATTVAENSATLKFTATAKSGATAEAGSVQLYANGVILTGDVITVAASGTGTFTVPLVGGYLPFASGSVVITGVFTPSTTGLTPSSSTVTLTVTDDRTTADFSINTATLTAVISPSSSNVNFVLQLASIANFAGLNKAIGLTCTVPAGSNLKCTLGSASVTMGTSGIATTTVEVSGYPTVDDGAVKPLMQKDHWWLLGGGTTLACVFLFGIPARRKGWQGFIVALVCTILVTGSMAGCGSQLSSNAETSLLGGGSGGHGTAALSGGIATNDVAPGTYNIVITGTATTNTTLVHNTQITVIVTTTPVLANGSYTLTNLSSQHLMTDTGASSAPGTQIEQFTADGTSDQLWVFTYSTANPGYYTIQNAANGLYVTDPGSQDCSGSVVNPTCTSGNTVTVTTLQNATTDGVGGGVDGTQLWTFNLLQGGYQILSGASGGVLDDDAFGSGNGTPVICYPPKNITDGDNQTWYIQ
jgi:hypothetical protein